MMRKAGILTVIVLLLFSGAGVAMVPPVAGPPNVVTLSEPIKINTMPASIPADNGSTSEITVSISLPEMLGGGVAANTKIEVSTTLGTLKDAENESNSGSEIELITNDSAIAVALLSGEEEGVANITVRAPAIEDAVNSILGNQTTVYSVKNDTVMTFSKEKVTKTDYGCRFYLKRGVDYISMPVIPAGDASPEAVFGADVEIWEWNDTTQNWVHPAVLEAGKGYLIRCPEYRQVDIHGTSAGTITWEMITSNLNDGWNLIGPGDKNIRITDSRTMVISWDAVDDKWITLHKGDMLYRGYGYWIME